MDFGSQYSRLIARRVRECHVYCEIVSHNADWDDVRKINPKGIILSGGQPAFMKKAHRLLRYGYTTAACLYWESATGCRC